MDCFTIFPFIDQQYNYMDAGGRAPTVGVLGDAGAAADQHPPNASSNQEHSTREPSQPHKNSGGSKKVDDAIAIWQSLIDSAT